jgi:hypothetical protein
LSSPAHVINAPVWNVGHLGDLIGQTVAVGAALTHLRTVAETVQRVNMLLNS